MGRDFNYFKLGLFILVCGAIGVMAAIWLGASRYFEKTTTYVTYFAESVKGLQQDAVVNYLGVAVGRVQSIGVAPDDRLIEVRMGLTPSFKVDPALAISLREQGLTGLRYLEIGEAPPDLEMLTPDITFPLEYPLIPSIPSQLEQLRVAFESIYAKVIAVDVEGLAARWSRTADLVNGLLADEGVRESIQNLQASTEGMKDLLTTLNAAVEEKDIRAIVASLRDASRQAGVFMDQLAKFSTRGDMKGGIKDLSSTLIASRKATESLARQLDALPPNALASLANDLDQTFQTGGDSLTRWNRQLDESIVLFQQSLHQLNLLLNQLTTLVQSVREQPARILFRGSGPDPFDGGR